MQIDHHVLIDRPYQGNGIWAAFAIFALFAVVLVLKKEIRKRKTGETINVESVIGAILFFLSLFALGVFQIVSHR